MTLIHAALETPPSLPRIALAADRLMLAKRRWRGIATDGTDFGFDLSAPLADGAAFFASESAVYCIAQKPEPVLEIALIPRPAPVARLGWTIGNLHFPIQVTDEVIRVPDDPALRQLFEREKIPFTACERVFAPFARSHSHESAA
ncbi:MAG: urease accessory protein UreE [Chthoniobacteraceae bacterium]